MLKTHHSCLNDPLTTVLRSLVAGVFLISAIISMVAGIRDPGGDMGVFMGLLNALLFGVIGYGVYTHPHKYASFAVVLLVMISSIGGLYTHKYLTDPIEGQESIFSSLTQWYITFSVAGVVCIAALILYFRSRYLYSHNKEVVDELSS